MTGMNIDVIFRPADLTPASICGRAVVVFDVLRATTTMAAALNAGVREIFIFDDLNTAASAAQNCDQPHILSGERNCLPPAGFDRGNSPGDFTPDVCAGRAMFMCTTNGTRAIVAARQAKVLLIGAIVNAAATARYLADLNLDVTLLCAGTAGSASVEDTIGAGAILAQLESLAPINLLSDSARIAHHLFRCTQHDLHAVFTDSQGGRNIRAVNLAADIRFASQLNTLNVVGRIYDEPLRVQALNRV